MVINRSKSRSGQTLDRVAPPGLTLLGHPQLQIRTFLNNLLTKGSVSGSTQDRKYSLNCLSCPDLLRFLEVKSNITGRSYSSINIKSHEIHCKIRNYIYLLSSKNYSIQYVGERITPVNLRMNIHQGKSGCEHSINHYKNVSKINSFCIHILEKLEGDSFINGQLDFAVQKLCLQRED